MKDSYAYFVEGSGYAMTRHEFAVATKLAAWKRANARCENCRLPFGGRRPEYHHRQEDFFGGAATLENCLCICPPCHRSFTSQAAPRMAKTRRQEKSVAGIKPKGRPLQGGRATRFKRLLTSSGPRTERRP